VKEEYLREIIEDSILLEKVKSDDRNSFKAKFLESIDVVSDSGELIDSLPRGLCHRLGLRHKTVFVIVVRDDGKMLLQTRGGGIDTVLNRLDIAVSGHFDSNDDNVMKGAIREFKEELGLNPNSEKMKLISEYNRDQPLSIYKPYERNRERRYLYLYMLTEEENLQLIENFEQRMSRGEVLSINWFTLDEVITQVCMGKTADGLLTSIIYYMRNKLNNV